MIPPYPLAWPEGFPRSPHKKPSKFKSSLASAVSNVESEIKRLAADTGKKCTNISITSNVGGLSSRAPDDTGVAVWFEFDGEMICVPVDRYPKVQDNLQAIYHVLDARRTEFRHAGIQMIRRSFKGFKALPPPDTTNQIAPPHWRKILGAPEGVALTKAEINELYRLRVRTTPEEQRGPLNVARDQALAAMADK